MIIEDYIKKSREAGLSDDQIRQALLKAGWQTGAIEQSLVGKISQNAPLSTASANGQSGRVIKSAQKLAHKGRNILHQWWFYIIVVVVISLPIGYYFVTQKSITSIQAPSDDVPNAIIIPNQVIMDSVHIDKVIVKEPAFLVIQAEDTAIAGVPNPNNALVNTNLLNPDTYENFDLTAIGKDMSERTPIGTVLVATLYKDMNDNRYYDLFADTEPALDASGNKIRITFYAK